MPRGLQRITRALQLSVYFLSISAQVSRQTVVTVSFPVSWEFSFNYNRTNNSKQNYLRLVKQSLTNTKSSKRWSWTQKLQCHYVRGPTEANVSKWTACTDRTLFTAQYDGAARGEGGGRQDGALLLEGAEQRETKEKEGMRERETARKEGTKSALWIVSFLPL